MSKTIAEKTAEAQEKINQDENKLKLLLRQQKEEECKARTNRICKRGGLLEERYRSPTSSSKLSF